MKPLSYAFAIACFSLPPLLASDSQSGLDASEVNLLSAQIELGNLEAKVALLKLPMRFKDAFENIGGNEVLKWGLNSRTSHLGKSRTKSVFAVIVDHLKGKGYVVVFEGAEISNGDSVVTRVAVGFATPLGPTYFADPNDASKIVMPNIDNGANQSSEPTLSSVTSPAGQEPRPR